MRQPLSRERVLAAAVELADAEGLKALTMRRLAATLDVEAMSLYHHLPAKEALLDGVAEAVVAEVVEAVITEDDADWRTVLRRQFLGARQIMLRHPWAPGLLATRKTVPVTLYGYYDRIVGTMTSAGFSYRLAHRAVHAFGSLPLGFAQETFSPADGDATEAEFEEMAKVLPHLTAMVTAEMHAADDPMLGWCDGQTEFEFTVDLLLDGLERQRENP